MDQQEPAERIITIALISDATGATSELAARAATAQFGIGTTKIVEWPNVRTTKAVNAIFEVLVNEDAVVIFTVADQTLGGYIRDKFNAGGIPAIALLEPVLTAIEEVIHKPRNQRIGAQHRLNQEYEQRIAAMEFANSHDDGRGQETLHEADLILVGVSRTSKTPTCMYLAYRGYRVGNVPLVKDIPFPAILDSPNCPAVIGLTVTPSRLAKVRENRLRSMGSETNSVIGYSDVDTIRREIVWARREMVNRGWPIINVTGRAVEETATTILQTMAGKTNG